MKERHLLRLGTALCVLLIIGATLPSLAGAQQASGGNLPTGVQVTPGPEGPPPLQLPHTGNPEAGTSGSLPGSVIGGGAAFLVLILLLSVRGSWLRKTLRRWQQ